MPKKLPYSSGDWIAIPLYGGGYAAGLIARTRKSGLILFGYFFGPKRKLVPSLMNLTSLSPRDAALRAMCGDLHLMDRRWLVVGRQPDWDPADWPMPSFARVDEVEKTALLVKYDENDPNKVLSEEPIELCEANKFPEDGLFGAGAIEEELASLLRRRLPRRGPARDRGSHRHR